MKRYLFLLLILAGPAMAGDDPPTLDQILDRYIEGLGGREAIARLETRTIVGKQIDDRPYKGPAVESKMMVWADAAGAWTMSLQEPGGEAVLNDTQNTRLAFLFNPQGPLMIEEYFPNLKMTGTWDYDGVQYYQVENDLELEYYTLYFEVETGRLTRIGYHWTIEEYREVDGVMVPAKIIQGRKGGSTNLYFDEVTHGAQVEEHLGPGGN